LLVDEEPSSPVEKTAADAGPKETGRTKSSRDEIVPDAKSENNSDAGLPSVKCTKLDGEDGNFAAETGDRSTSAVAVADGETVCDDSSGPQLSMSSASLAARSRRVDREPNSSDSDSRQTKEKSSPEGRRRSSVRTATSRSAQVPPKRRKVQREEDNADSDTSDESDNDDSHVKMSL